MPCRLLSFSQIVRPATLQKPPANSLGRLADDLQLLAIHDPAALRVLARMTGRFAVKIRKAINN